MILLPRPLHREEKTLDHILRMAKLPLSQYKTNQTQCMVGGVLNTQIWGDCACVYLCVCVCVSVYVVFVYMIHAFLFNRTILYEHEHHPP